jgi:hypothetical protein
MNLPEWSEYALDTLLIAVWGLVTLSMLLQFKSKPESRGHCLMYA